MVCAPCTQLRLSMNCGAVTARCVCGEMQLGAEMLMKEPEVPNTQESLHGGSLAGSPKFGLDSPKVKVNAKRLNPVVNSFTRFGENTCRYPTATFFPLRRTSPSGGNPGKTCGRAFRKSPSLVSKWFCR